MKIAIITGPRKITDDDEQLVRDVVREVITRGFQIYVGDAKGVDSTAIQESFTSQRWDNLKPAQAFGVIASLGRTPAGLAERSTRMVKEALAQACGRGCFHDEIICVGFPNRACPTGIVPAKSWRSGTDEGSGTWSTLALAVGHNIETWIFPLREHKMSRWYIDGWLDSFQWEQFGKQFSGWHFTQTSSLFTEVQS